jgi:spore photoproduct lyase
MVSAAPARTDPRGLESAAAGRPARLWRPRRVLVTRGAREWEHGRDIVARADALGLEVVELPSDRLALDLPPDTKQAYAEATSTLAVVVAPPSKRRLQPIAPSADWRVDLAEGCPAHSVAFRSCRHWELPSHWRH